MINQFRAFDSQIIAGARKFAHWFQMLTGRTNFFLAKIGTFLIFYAALVQMADHFFKFTAKPPGLLFVFICIAIAWSTAHDGKLCEDADRFAQTGAEVLSDSVRQVRNRSFSGSIVWRFLWIWSLLYDLVDCWLEFHYKVEPHIFLYASEGFGFSLGVLIFSYFVLVDPLRPQKSKVREWIESFGRGKLVQEKV
jgi:hypothetical protein